MEFVGVCRLCRNEKPLLRSHLLPSALYGNRKQYQLSTPKGTSAVDVQIRQRLLCHDCEQRFDRNGESHVLAVIAPKCRKRFPLRDRMKLAWPNDSDGRTSRFSGPALGLNVDMFTYFAISVVWRMSVSEWKLPDGTTTSKEELGTFRESVRLYLLGETPLPLDISVIVIVCSDAVSRARITGPGSFDEGCCVNFRFLARGITFRVVIGSPMPEHLRVASCTSPFRPIWFTDCEKETLERNLVPVQTTRPSD